MAKRTDRAYAHIREMVVAGDVPVGGRLSPAALANWKPISVYGLLVFLFGGIVPGVITALIALLAPESFAFTIALFFSTTSCPEIDITRQRSPSKSSTEQRSQPIRSRP